MRNTKIWKNKVYFIPRKGLILASKYCILNLKSPFVPYWYPKNAGPPCWEGKMGWTFIWQTGRRQASSWKTEASLQRQSQEHPKNSCRSRGRSCLKPIIMWQLGQQKSQESWTASHGHDLDCGQSLFCSKFHGEERREELVLRSSPWIFEQQRDCSQTKPRPEANGQHRTRELLASLPR